MRDALVAGVRRVYFCVDDFLSIGGCFCDGRAHGVNYLASAAEGIAPLFANAVAGEDVNLVLYGARVHDETGALDYAHGGEVRG